MTQRKKTRTTTVEHEIARAGLTAEEERVLRLRRGIGAPGTAQLELKATPNEQIRQELLALEKELVFKLQSEQAQRAERKKKIVNTLRSKKK